MFPRTLIEDFRLRLTVVAAVVLAFTACFGASGDAGHVGCSGLEVPPNRDGLISRSEAERLVTERLAAPAPGASVSDTEIERVWASCLTTLRSYEHDPVKSDIGINPEFFRADAPVWIVEVKGTSWPAGFARRAYVYALLVIHAETGDGIAGRRHWEPLLEPAEQVRE